MDSPRSMHAAPPSPVNPPPGSSARGPVFTDFDAPFDPSYRPVSRIAWCSVPTTLVSLLALLTPVLWFVPLMSALLAAWAIRRIARSGVAMSGGKLAWVMFAVSGGLLGFAPARYLTANALAVDQAVAYADAWFELLKEGRHFEAHQLTLSVGQRQPPGADLGEHYRDRLSTEGAKRMVMMEMADPANELRMFLDAPPIKRMRGAGRGFRAEYGGASVFHSIQVNPLTVVELRYDIVIESGAETGAIPLTVTLERETNYRTGQSHWRLKNVADRK
ncbi:MAG: hypothetical protein FJ297_17815 [Planctomycetes bacterium]|nr:hypothetical protein [Planctomycetota bacterium]